MQGAEARAAAGFGKSVSTEQDFPWFPDYRAGLEASGWHSLMYTGGTQTWAHVQGCMKPGRGQGVLWGIFQSACIPQKSCMLNHRHPTGPICPGAQTAATLPGVCQDEATHPKGWHLLSGTQGVPRCQCLSGTAWPGRGHYCPSFWRKMKESLPRPFCPQN